MSRHVHELQVYQDLTVQTLPALDTFICGSTCHITDSAGRYNCIELR